MGELQREGEADREWEGERDLVPANGGRGRRKEFETCPYIVREIDRIF